MAEAYFVVSGQEWRNLVASLLAEGCSIAADTQSKREKIELLDTENVEEFLPGQFFVKSPTFSQIPFQGKWVDNIHSGRIFLIDQFASDGHITILGNLLVTDVARAVSLSIGYRSFFVPRPEVNIRPRPELIAFYRKLVSTLKNATYKLELWKGRNIWVKQDIDSDRFDLDQTIRHSHGVLAS